jgi:formylglycine-generating enzyme required for sulfatase activity
MEFVLLPGGEFQMGSPASEMSREGVEIPHTVYLTQPFYLGLTEVTQHEWRIVMGDNPSRGGDCPACPVEGVSWFDTQRFIIKLTSLSGFSYRLPTEAQWEYACRAGTSTPFSTGERLTAAQANYDGRYPMPGEPAGEYRGGPTPVRSFDPNAWGLYDLHGNVWEWTADWYCPYPKTTVVDPQPKCPSDLRVIRGGSWAFDEASARCALRYTHQPIDSGYSLGFRLVRLL